MSSNPLLLSVVVAMFYYILVSSIVSMETVHKVSHLNIFFSSIYYYLIDCPLPQNCRNWYDLGIRKSCYYPIYPDGKTQKLVSTVYNSTNKFIIIFVYISHI